jgi:hypothetical protein
MKVERLTISLAEHEMIALQKRAQGEFRPVKEQARYILLDALGLIHDKPVTNPTNANTGAATVYETRTAAGVA